MSYQRLQGRKYEAVTKSDTDNITYLDTEIGACVLYIGTGGSLRVINELGNDEVFENIPNGTFFPVHVIRVHTDSTADDIIAIW